MLEILACRMPFAFAASASVVRFTFSVDDLEDKLDDELVLVDALFDARDDLDDRLELFDLPVVVITSVFGSVFAL